MPAFRLRVRTTEIDLPIGELAMGRGSDCFLRIDDDLVSRRHARLLVTEDTVLFEDLGSRNGSRVNGKRAEPGQIPLKVGDTFEVGSQVFELITGSGKDMVSRTMLPHRPCRGCGVLIEASLLQCPHCGASQREAPETTAEFDDPPPQTQGFASSFALVTGLGDKLLALGRIEEAERMFGPRLRDLLTRARDGERFDEKTFVEAMRRGAKIAVLTGRDDWYSWVFEVARLLGRRLDARTLDELHTNMMIHKPGVGAALADYLASQTGEDAETQLYRRRLDALLRFCRA